MRHAADRPARSGSSTATAPCRSRCAPCSRGPGVVVASTGVALPAQYRGLGARTTYFILKLPSLVGDPGKPGRPGDDRCGRPTRTYDRAVASTLCDRPWIALNELAGPAERRCPGRTPSAPTARTSSALMRRLTERGATPVLFVHGSPVYTGEAKAWWKEVGATGHVVYESYYKAPGIMQRGRIIGPRRLRLGMRSVMTSFANAGVPRNHLGVMLGFQVAPGKSGREGLQPSSDWFRYVKWNALAARQVALDEGTRLDLVVGLGQPQRRGQGSRQARGRLRVPVGARPVALRRQDGRRRPASSASLVEGPDRDGGQQSTASRSSESLPKATVLEHSAYLGNLDAAVSATFVRQVLRKRLPIPQSEIDARRSGRDRTSPSAGHATRISPSCARTGRRQGVARGILEDALRRERIVELVGRGRHALLDRRRGHQRDRHRHLPPRSAPRARELPRHRPARELPACRSVPRSPSSSPTRRLRRAPPARGNGDGTHDHARMGGLHRSRHPRVPRRARSRQPAAPFVAAHDAALAALVLERPQGACWRGVRGARRRRSGEHLGAGDRRPSRSRRRPRRSVRSPALPSSSCNRLLGPLRSPPSPTQSAASAAPRRWSGGTEPGSARAVASRSAAAKALPPSASRRRTDERARGGARRPLGSSISPSPSGRPPGSGPARSRSPRPLASDYDPDGSFSRDLEVPEHAGTHLDAPAHFVPGGAPHSRARRRLVRPARGEARRPGVGRRRRDRDDRTRCDRGARADATA